jgi:AcrR family transcriptional regulator
VTGSATTRRRAKGAEREGAVVEAAAELIAEQGLANLRVADIADRAGMSVGHVTYYFPSKSELLMRAIRVSEDRFHAEVDERLGQESDPWQRLATLVELATSDGPGDPGWVLWFDVWAHSGSDAGVARTQRELDQWWRGRLADVVGYGVERGAFRDEDRARAVATLSALTDGLAVQVTLGGAGLTAASARTLVMDTAVDLLRPRRT